MINGEYDHHGELALPFVKTFRMPKIDVLPIAGSAKEFGLYVNDILIGTSKHQFDADHAKVMLEKALTLSR